MYNIIADLHTHTIASTHAYSTIAEMAVSARDKGLYALAITDHASPMPGGPGPWYFSNLRSSVPLFYKDVLILAGIEADVIDFEGHLDLEPIDEERLDWVVASIHDVGFPGLENPDFDKCTALWLGVAKNPAVNVIGHSGSPKFAYDYEKVIPAFGANGKLVEINSHSFDVRADNIKNCRQIALTCKKYGVSIVVDSDAHFETQIADFHPALQMLEEISFPEELIVNSSKERLHAYLEKHSKIAKLLPNT
ncbi:phosphatase [Scatolibacter rhodanostii]|uniref:phosphatase n=1 Tax=Scatolibacter rhodanostii TaxID=2014781 RepID=UPI000C08B01D|nr:phosphatase [Scatolibacter rhodanostii]